MLLVTFLVHSSAKGQVYILVRHCVGGLQQLLRGVAPTEGLLEVRKESSVSTSVCLGGAMLVAAIIDRVHLALEEYGKDCSMEEVVGLCPDLTWNQVYLAIDYLNKTGMVRVALDPDRTYTIQVYPAFSEAAQSASQQSPVRKASL